MAVETYPMVLEAYPMAVEAHPMELEAHPTAVTVRLAEDRRAELMPFSGMPTLVGMKMSQPELLVGLEGKLERVLEHWALVDAALPPSRPLWLLEDLDRAASEALAEELPGLRRALRAQEQAVTLAWAEYQRRKAEMHEWLRAVNQWARAWLRGTEWFALVGRVPGRERAFQIWQDSALDALMMWQKLELDPPPAYAGWPFWDPQHCTLQNFEEDFAAFEAAHRAVGTAEMELRMARSELRFAQKRGTALLMAYGHGVRARLGHKGTLVKSIPNLWPRHRRESD